MSSPSCTGGVVIDGAAMTADITHAAGTAKLVDLEGCDTVGIASISASATHAGTIKFRMKNRPGDTGVDHATTVTVSNGAALNDFQNLTGLGCKYLEVWYDFTSGTGTLTVVVHRKKVGR